MPGDCGVFMTRTADYLSRNGLLDFSQVSLTRTLTDHLSRDGLLPVSQANMPYFRRRMVLEILTTTLL